MHRAPTPCSAVVVAASLFAVLGPAQAAAPSAAREHEKLGALLDSAFEDKLRDHPEFATYIKFPGHNAAWTDLSAAGIERRQAATRAQLQAARALDRGVLSPEDRGDLELFVRRLEGQVEGLRFPDDELAVTQSGGIQQEVPFALGTAPA